MSYSQLAWSGIARYFWLLEKIRYRRPLRWNCEKMGLEIDPRPQWFIWTIGNIIGFFTCFIVPPYIFLEQVMTTKDRNLNAPQVIILIAFFALGVPGVPVFVHTIRTINELVQGFNHLITIEKFVRGQSHSVSVKII
jgi:hypothetical protein